MSSSPNLTCNFTISSSVELAAAFQSADGGANYGGQITIFTPVGAGPLTTGLWDNDGNVYFTIYNPNVPGQNCVINSSSDPGSWTPYVTVASANGLSCIIGPPDQTGPSTYNYTLTIAPDSCSAATAVPGAMQFMANMMLPAGGMEAWTKIMQGAVPVPDQINTGSPVVMAWARFDDGTQVVGGVYKYDDPTEYNVKFMWVFDVNGNQYPGWPIDVSDDQDFFNTAYEFTLSPDSGVSYLLNIVEQKNRISNTMNTHYVFTTTLFDASANQSTLQPFLTGTTLTFDASVPDNVTGALMLTGYLNEPVPFTGTTTEPGTAAGSTLVLSGHSSEAQITLTLTYNFDGFLYDGSYVGGLLSILDFAAQETYLYVIQGQSAQGPGGTGTGLLRTVDTKRKPPTA